MTFIERVVKWTGTILMAALSAYMTMQISLGILQSRVGTLEANAASRVTSDFDRESRLMGAIGDLKGEIGGLRSDVKHLTEELDKQDRARLLKGE